MSNKSYNQVYEVVPKQGVIPPVSSSATSTTIKAALYWSSLDDIRKERKRNLRYKNGDQWSDYVLDEDGNRVKEEVLLSKQGRTPLKHNFMNQLVRNIMGQVANSNSQSIVYCRSSDDTELGEMLTNTLQACNKLNKSSKVNMNALEELLLAGICIAKVRYDFFSEKNRSDGKIEIVNINRLFFNTDIEDPRFNEDLNFIGEYHDYTMSDILRNFATSPHDEQELKMLFSNYEIDYGISMEGMSGDKMDNINAFMSSSNPSRHRIIEVWEKLGRWITYVHDYADGSMRSVSTSIEEIGSQNQRRIDDYILRGEDPTQVKLMYAEQKYEYYWSVRYLTMCGRCLKEMETPFTHESHPYVIGTLPMVDGNIKSAIGDLIDQQRYINRLIVMIDSIIGAGAKGVLMIPENAIPDGYSVQDFSDEYVKVDGVIVYKPSVTGEKPYQISKNATDVGAWQMLQMQMQLFEQVSGVSGAMQGHKATSGKPSSLYAQEAENSSINFAVLFSCLNSFNEDKDEKLLKVLMQYYSEKRHVDISGSSFKDSSRVYDPQKAEKIVDFNVVIKQSSDTPVFRQMSENFLISLVEKGLIPIEIALEHSTIPIMQKIKQGLATPGKGVSNPRQRG